MNLSFSTRGWQNLSFEELGAVAEEMHFAGIELYDIHKREDLTGRSAPLDRYNQAASLRELRARGIEIPCLDTSCDLAGDDLDTILWTVERAGAMHVKYAAFDIKTVNDEVVIPRLGQVL